MGRKQSPSPDSGLNLDTADVCLPLGVPTIHQFPDVLESEAVNKLLDRASSDGLFRVCRRRTIHECGATLETWVKPEHNPRGTSCSVRTSWISVEKRVMVEEFLYFVKEIG